MVYTDELYHHGIKGQKWGVRRFQNADGSRTAAGRKRESMTRKKATIEDAEKLATLARTYHGLQSDEYRTILGRVTKGGQDADFDAAAKKVNNYLDQLDKDMSSNYKPKLDEYCMYASTGWERRHGDSDNEAIRDLFLSYREDDADQGPYNSYAYYLVANGKNPNKFQDQYHKTMSSLENESKRVAKDLLGDHANDVIEQRGDWARTVTDNVSNDLRDMAITDKYYRYQPYNKDRGYRYSATEIKNMKEDITYARKNGLVPAVQHYDAQRNYLIHHGIKGQKWGLRRFQNPDGSRTPAGAARELKRYQRKELHTLDRMNRRQTRKEDRQIAKAQIKMSRAAARGGGLFRTARVNKRQHQIEDLKQKKLYRQGLYASERARVMRMTIDDVDRERAGLMKNRGERSVMQMFSKGRLDREFKTSQRVTEEQRQNAYSNAYMLRSAMS